MITISKLFNLPVYTKSGTALGKIIDVEIDSLNQAVLRYYIKSSAGLLGLWQDNLIITAEQVISISDKEMVVEDLVITDKSPAIQPTI